MSILLSAFPTFNTVPPYDLSRLPVIVLAIGDTATNRWIEFDFKSTGNLEINKFDGVSITTQVVADVALSPSSTWVRLNYIAGASFDDGLAAGTFYQLNADRLFRRDFTTSGGGTGISGQITFDLSSDSSGTPIEDTSNVVAWRIDQRIT